MKRFWKEATVEAQAGGHAVLLDGRALRTPGKRVLLLPTAALAAAVAAEWREVGAEIRPGEMALTGLANAALDIVAEEPDAFAADLARYAASDLLCYRAEHPTPLVTRQAEAWDPLLRWAEQRFDIGFAVTAGIVPVNQPAAVLERIEAAFAALAPFPLAAMSPLVSISGSAVIPLALAEGAADVDAAWAASMLDEHWQAEKWGDDAEASASRSAREAQFRAAARFLALAGEVSG
ncbi:ATP12 family protein [Sandaracinobacteroides hominis]|uniref:ATP12 family protein n=1 Tax=Sandaracinobacteroides hominis TaxID=2780086 RepID=UPI0018F4B064|nr:ATP12 family protein [Sandaracinobacteroides hominis]